MPSSVALSNAPGNLAAPSDVVWSSCPRNALNEDTNGAFIHEDFIGGTEVFTANTVVGKGEITIKGQAGTLIPHRTGDIGGVQQFTVSNTDNNGVALVTQPMARMTLGSDQRFWAEVRIYPQSITEARGVAFGFAGETGLSEAIIANGHTSAANFLKDDDFVGFIIATNAPTKVQLAYRKTSSPTVIINADAGSVNAAIGDLKAAGSYKLGLLYNGKDTVSFYINGLLVGSMPFIPATRLTKNLGAIFCLKTRAAATASVALDWFRAAGEFR